MKQTKLIGNKSLLALNLDFIKISKESYLIVRFLLKKTKTMLKKSVKLPKPPAVEVNEETIPFPEPIVPKKDTSRKYNELQICTIKVNKKKLKGECLEMFLNSLENLETDIDTEFEMKKEVAKKRLRILVINMKKLLFGDKKGAEKQYELMKRLEQKEYFAGSILIISNPLIRVIAEEIMKSQGFKNLPKITDTDKQEKLDQLMTLIVDNL